MRIDYGTNTVKARNEDAFGITNFAAFVMDGASALLSESCTPTGNDIVWMVEWWKKYLIENLDNLNLTIQEILKEGIRNFNNDFSKYRDPKILSKLEQCSSGISIIRKNERTLECFTLGDVEIAVRYKDSKIESITDIKLRNLDDMVIDMICNSKEKKRTCVFKDFTEDELKILKDNRNKMNTDDGYYILSHDIEAVDKGIYKEISIKNVESCLLFSDGFHTLDYFYTKDMLFEKVKKEGVEHTIDELREIENRDLEMKRYKRLKAHDDATGIYIEWGE